MLQIRIGWLAYAMRLMLKHRHYDRNNEKEKKVLDVYDLSPSEIKLLLLDVLNIETHKDLTWLQRKQIAGALNKVVTISNNID